MPRLTHFQWTQVKIGPIRTVTPGGGERIEPVTPTSHLTKLLGFEQAKAAGDTRPTLVYFHWPHEDEAKGRLTTALCTRILNDEMAARWGKLFRCVQVDMGDAVAALAAKIGATDEPGFVVLGPDLQVRARIPALKSSAKLVKALQRAFRKFPDARKALDRALKEQERLLDEAKALDRKRRYAEALERVDQVRYSDVRVGRDWQRAVAYGQLLAQKAERARKRR